MTKIIELLNCNAPVSIKGKTMTKTIDKLNLFGKISKVHAQEIETIIQEEIREANEEGYERGHSNGFDIANKHFKKRLANQQKTIKQDLLKIADKGEYEDLRREVEDYFN